MSKKYIVMTESGFCAYPARNSDSHAFCGSMGLKCSCSCHGEDAAPTAKVDTEEEDD